MLGARPKRLGLGAVELLLRHLAPAVLAVVLDVDVPVAAVRGHHAEEGAEEQDSSPRAVAQRLAFEALLHCNRPSFESSSKEKRPGRGKTHCVLLEALFFTDVSTRRMQKGQSTVSGWSPSMCSGVTVATAVDMSSVPAYPMRW